MLLNGSMNLITGVSFIAVIVQLIDVTSKVVNYLNDVKDTPKDQAKISREAALEDLAGLPLLFTDLRY